MFSGIVQEFNNLPRYCPNDGSDNFDRHGSYFDVGDVAAMLGLKLNGADQVEAQPRSSRISMIVADRSYQMQRNIRVDGRLVLEVCKWRIASYKPATINLVAAGGWPLSDADLLREAFEIAKVEVEALEREFPAGTEFVGLKGATSDAT